MIARPLSLSTDCTMYMIDRCARLWVKTSPLLLLLMPILMSLVRCGPDSNPTHAQNANRHVTNYAYAVG